MSELYGKARDGAKSNEGRFGAHVCGQFPGKIEKIVGGVYKDREFYEISIRTQYGIAKSTIWKTTEVDGMKHLMEKGATAEEAAADIQKKWTRVCRLYNDLGMESPEDEILLYEQLGSLVGKECWTVVKENSNDPQSPMVFINAPKKNGTVKLEAQKPTTVPIAGSPANSGTGATTCPGLDDIPF